MADRPFIECAEQSIPIKEGHDLQLWLGKGECKTLERVIESKVRQHMAEVANAALLAVSGAPLKMNLADEHLREAARYRDFLKILQSVKDQSETFTVNKWI